MQRAARQQHAERRNAEEQEQTDPELVKRLASGFEAPVGQAHHHHNGNDGQHQADDEWPESFGHRSTGHVQAPVADKEGVVDVDTAPRSRQGQEHREVPEQDLQQRWNVTESLDIHGGQLVDHPVR
ncbi:hypothetical protein D9M71_376750 [compost metagenome]